MTYRIRSHYEFQVLVVNVISLVSTVSRRSVHMTCPDCPSPVPTEKSNPKVLEAATESLAKYNRESTSKKYSLVEVTQATSQVRLKNPAVGTRDMAWR